MSNRAAVEGVGRQRPVPVHAQPDLCRADPDYLGVTAAFGGLCMAVMLLPALVIMRYGVIAREERYLEAKFA